MRDRSLRLTGERSVVVLVDLQERLMPAMSDEAAVRQRARLLGLAAGETGVPVVGTEQNPGKMGPLVEPFTEMCARVMAKTAFGACEAGLLDVLDEVAPGRDQVVLSGCEAHVCLLQTALGVVEAGREAWVVADACGSRDVRDRDAAMSRLATSGVRVVTAEMAAFEWLGASDHEHFRAVSRLVKEPRHAQG